MGKPTVKSMPTKKGKSNQKVITKKFKDEIKKLLKSKDGDSKTATKKEKVEKEQATSSKSVEKSNSKTNSDIKKILNQQSNSKNGTSGKNGDVKKILNDIKTKKEPVKEKAKKTSNNKRESTQSKNKNVLKTKPSTNSQNGKTENKKKPLKIIPSSKTNGSTNVKKIANEKPKKSVQKVISDNKKLINGNSKKTAKVPQKQVGPEKLKKNIENNNLKNDKKKNLSDPKRVKATASTNKNSVKKVESKTEKKAANKRAANVLAAPSNSTKSKDKKIKPVKLKKDPKKVLKNNKAEKPSLSLKRKTDSKKSKDLKRIKCDCAPNIKILKDKKENKTTTVDEKMIAKYIIKNVIDEDNKIFGLNASDDDSDASSYIDQFFDAEDEDVGSIDEKSESSSESDDDMSDEDSDSDLSDVNVADMSLDQLIKEYGNSESSNSETQLVKYVNNKSEEESDEEDDEDYECDLSTSDSYSDGNEDDDDDSDIGDMENCNSSNSDDCNDDCEDHDSSDEWEDLEYSGENLDNILKKHLAFKNIVSTADINSNDSSNSELSFSSNDSDTSDTDSNEIDFDETDFDDDLASEDDTDYIPDEDFVEDLIIRHGNAKIYDANDKNISFDSNSPQIFEIKNVENNEQEVASQMSDDSCPQLIKIDDCKSKNITNNEKPPIVQMTENIVDTEMFDTNNDETVCTEYKDFSGLYGETSEDNFTVTTIDMAEHSEAHSNEELYTDLSSSDLYEEVSTEDEYASDDSEVTETYNEQDFYEEDESDVEECDVNKFKCYKSINCQQVLLHINDRVILHGCIKIQLLVGSVEILGYTMKQNETKEIFSPRGNTFLCITPIEPERTNQNLLDEQIDNLKLLFLDEDLHDIKNHFNQTTDSLILAEQINDSKKIFMIKNYMKQKVFPTENDISVERPYYTCEYLLKTLFYTNYQRKLIYNLEWENIVMHKNSKLLLTGGKSVGKSTLLRYLINKNINEHKKILLIDLDIGQTEVFLPETVSATVIDQPLLGPGYLHNLKPDKSYLYGDFSINSCPIKYIKCVYNLLKYCNNFPEYQNMPWLINTMGYTKGFGMEIISTIIKLLSPTEVVQIQNINRKIENFVNDLTPEFINKMNYNILNKEIKEIFNKNLILKYNLTKISSMVNKRKDVSGWEISSIDLRTIYILAHLSGILAKSNSNWLTDVKPIVGSLKNLKFHISSNVEVSPEFVHKVLNANIVFLCNKNETNNDFSFDCFGLGIVRGIDKFADKIYLLSPLELHEMKDVNTLAIGTTPIPSSIILIQSSSVQGKVPYVYNGKDFIGSKHVQNVYKSDIQISA